MADEEQVLVVGALFQELVEVLKGGFGGEAIGVEDLGFVAGLGTDEGCGLKAALEGAGDDEVELDIEGVQDVCELKAVLLALFVEGTLDVEEWIGTARSCAGVAENV
jgi:hypothetical protein